MSLYNMVLGVNPYAPVLVSIVLGMDPQTVPRLRDCWWNGEHIVLFTRTGGGNRAAYEEQNKALATWPGYVKDEDDTYDTTYALFYYTMPPKFEWIKDKLVPETRTLKERFEEALERLKTADKDDPYVKKVMEGFEPLARQLKTFLEDEGKPKT